METGANGVTRWDEVKVHPCGGGEKSHLRFLYVFRIS